MATVNVNVQPEILKWVLNQTKEEKLGETLMGNITKWLDGSKTPTFCQVEDLSKRSNIPLGYFFLQKPPVEQMNLLEYRTVNSVHLANPSRELMDTIHEMESIQTWMVEYRQDMGYDSLLYVGSMNTERKVEKIADQIRENLNLKVTWFEACKTVLEAFAHIRKCLEECGVIVMMSGIAGKNTHRVLDTNEFRAFAMVDSLAPLIFINTADSEGAKLFSLLHETVHIWLGENDLYNVSRMDDAGNVDQTETLCNAVAAELLVPAIEFQNKWSSITNENDSEKISILSRFFRCGEVVIARRALDFGKIKKELYSQTMQNALDFYNRRKDNKASGGNYYNTLRSRLDENFARALTESVSMGRTTYTEAWQLTNTNRKTFDKLMQYYGGI